MTKVKQMYSDSLKVAKIAIKQENKTIRTEVRQENKTERAKLNRWWLFFIGVVVGVLSRYVEYYVSAINKCLVCTFLVH